MRVISTPGLHGCSVQFSPFYNDRLAVASSQHYAIAGRGALLLYELNGSMSDPALLATPRLIRRLDYKDGLFDVVFSEQRENHVLTCSGDGSLQLWDVSLIQPTPIQSYAEHLKEAYCASWSMTDKASFVSGSWDSTVKLWDPAHPGSIATFTGHTGIVYACVFHPRRRGVLASVSADGFACVWDVRRPAAPVQRIQVHATEALSADWNKYADVTLVTASVDKTIKGWDLRRASQPLFILEGHEYAVRRIKCSPHKPNIILSCSYDMTTRVWDTALPAPQAGVSSITANNTSSPSPLLPPDRRPAFQTAVVDQHSEFIVGIDFNLAEEGLVADCAWDETVTVLKV